MGLSAGGPAGFRAMNSKAINFQGYICIASGLPQRDVADVSFTEPILMLNGVNDVRFPIRLVRRSIAKMKSVGLNVEQTEVDSDHFFLLTDSVETLRTVESFIEKHSMPILSTIETQESNGFVKFMNPLVLLCLGGTVLGLVSFVILRDRNKKLAKPTA
jgi:hypothetical protein